jgi:hypothetical protein
MDKIFVLHPGSSIMAVVAIVLVETLVDGAYGGGGATQCRSRRSFADLSIFLSSNGIVSLRLREGRRRFRSLFLSPSVL